MYIFSLSLKQNGMLFGLMQTNMIDKERERNPATIPLFRILKFPMCTILRQILTIGNGGVLCLSIFFFQVSKGLIFPLFVRKECACTAVRLFAILSMQRSGSGWFETLLNSHKNISSNGEIFSVKERRSNITSITKTLDKLYNLDWYSSAAKNECTAAVGLKWMLNQVTI
jgi:hypothetical protein